MHTSLTRQLRDPWAAPVVCPMLRSPIDTSATSKCRASNGEWQVGTWALVAVGRRSPRAGRRQPTSLLSRNVLTCPGLTERELRHGQPRGDGRADGDPLLAEPLHFEEGAGLAALIEDG